MDTQDATIQTVRRMLQEARRVAVLTGAGISAESGLPTYRGATGLWAGFSMKEYASAEGFAHDPEKVWGWHDERRMVLAAVKPNPGHLALAELERQLKARGGQFAMATQNVDGLHQAGGSQNVLELHGTILAVKCSRCERRREIGFEPITGVPRCDCGAPMRPDIVWFGEMLPEAVWQAAFQAASACDVFLTVGTSAVVYPAASLIEIAAGGGAKTVEVNPDATAVSGVVTISLRGKAGEILPALLAM
jgi:NAD-dependent deacetylase